jgi:anti-sigma B factor antagonist
MGVLTASAVAGESGPIVTLSGEADWSSAGQLSELMNAQLSGGARQVRVDVSGLRFADSASVRVLVLTGRALKQRGGTLILVRPQPAVARVLELMGADQLLVVQGGNAAAPSGSGPPGSGLSGASPSGASPSGGG